MLSLKESAIRYAEFGYLVFPVARMAKYPPCFAQWPQRATNDTNQVAAWWDEFPDANVAIHCHEMVVIDIDGHKNWPQDLWDILAEIIQSPDVAVDTPRAGGQHYWFALPPGVTLRNSVAQPFPGLDIKTSGGYVICPPSCREEGRYRWKSESEEIVPRSQLSVIPRNILSWIQEFQSGNSKTDKYRRAKEDPAVILTEGHRNDVLYRFASFLRRNGGSLSQIRSYIAEMNRERCQPPLPFKEIAQMAESVAMNLDVNQLAQADAEGWEQMYVMHTQGTGEIPQRFFDECHPTMQSYIKWCIATNSRPQPALALGSAIACMLALASRKIVGVSQAGFKTYSRGYVLLLVGSSEGKERPRECLIDVLSEAGSDTEKMLSPEDFTSPAAILEELVNCGGRMVSSIDEIGRVLWSWKNSPTDSSGASAIATLLMTVYNSSKRKLWKSRGYANVKNRRELVHPHLTVLGTSVPGYVWDALGVESIGDGLLGRMLMFEGEECVRMVYRNAEVSEDIPDDVLSMARDWNDYIPQGNYRNSSTFMQPWRYTDEAETAFRTWIDRVEDVRAAGPVGARAVWGRAPERAALLALANAVANGPKFETIDYDSIVWATGLEEHLTRRLLHQSMRWTAESDWEKMFNRVLRAVQDAKEGYITGSALWNLTRKMKPTERKMLQEDLINSGAIVAEMHKTGGKKPETRYYPKNASNGRNGQNGNNG